MDDVPNGDRLLASVAKYLLEEKDEQAVAALLTCEIDRLWVGEYKSGDRKLHLELRAPNAVYKVLSVRDVWTDEMGTYVYSPVHRIERALLAVLPHAFADSEIEVRGEFIEVGEEWRAELIDQVRGSAVDNQAADAPSFRLYNNLRFRSASEIKIAEALDRAGVMYFPLCKGRMNNGKSRVTREPDFLICNKGKWGVLEVDGEPFHPPSRTVHDHERDRLFKAHGVVVVEHFDSKDCYEYSDAVVKKFLGILENARPG